MDINDTNIQADRPLLNQQNNKKRKCHGNRRDQRFRRKCRARQMKSVKIEQLLKKHKQVEKKSNRRTDYIEHVTDDNSKTTTTVSNEESVARSNPSKSMTTTGTNFNKRKRDVSLQELKSKSIIPKSISSISIGQPLLKKKKKKITDTITTTTTSITTDNMNITNNYQFVFVLFFILCLLYF